MGRCGSGEVWQWGREGVAWGGEGVMRRGCDEERV